MSAPDLTLPIRAALLAEATVTDLLSPYFDSFPIFTRRPITPAEISSQPYPCIIVSKNIAVNEEDGINDYRPIIMRDVAVYGRNEPSSAYHDIDAIANAVRDMFHRKKPITVPDWSVTLILAIGPTDIRLEQDNFTGRVVQLSVRVAKLR